MFKRGYHKLALFTLLIVAVALVTSSIAMYSKRQMAAGKQSNSAATIAKPAYAAARVRAMNLYGKLPLSFERNDGQTNPQVKFLSRGPGYTLFLTPMEAVLAFHKTPPMARNDARLHSPSRVKAGADSSKNLALAVTAPVASAKQSASKPEKAETEVLSVKLIGANPHAELEGVDRLPGKSNYFIGNDPKKWHTNVPAYSKVRYRDVYPGIDMVYYGTNQRQLEYDFILAPGSNPGAIRLSFDGANRLGLNRDGDVVVTLADGGTVTQHLPAIYQEHNGKRVKVDGRAVLRGKNTVGFELAAYDQQRPVYIDPGLVYSTYLGGTTEDFGFGIAVDSAGSAYVTGWAYSVDFPTTSGAFHTVGPGAFVTKFNADGTALIYSTYLGGSIGSAAANGIVLDSEGDAYVIGNTSDFDFPTTPGAFQTTNHSKSLDGQNAFVTKLNASGTALLYSTYLGGRGAFSTSDDSGNAITVDSAGNAYVTGLAVSADFPITAGAFQTVNSVCQTGNAFVTKLNPDGTALLYSTFLGGSACSASDFGRAIAVDSTGSAYVTGLAGPSDDNSVCARMYNPINCCTGAGTGTCGPFPTTPGAFQTVNPGGEITFVTKFNASGTALVYSSLLNAGGQLGAGGHGIAIDSAGNAYVTGPTASFIPTTPGAFQTVHKASIYAGFVTKFVPDGTALSYSTYLSGSYDDFPESIALDAAGNAYVAGFSWSTDFPTTPGAFQSVNKAAANIESDAFVTKLNSGGTALLYSTYLGGSGNISTGDGGEAIAIDASGEVYVTGYSSSYDFPTTPGAFQTVNNAPSYPWTNAFVAKLDPVPSPTPTATATSTPTATATVTATVTLTATATKTATASKTATRSPTKTPTATATATATATPTATVSATATATATSTTSVTATPTATATSTATASTSSTPTATSTPTETATRIGATPTATATSGSTATPTTTATPTATPTATATPISEKLTISPHSLAFGKRVAVGKTSKAKTVTIKNAGKKKKGLPVNIEMETTSPSIFALKSQCEKTLKPGQSCKVSVTFTPADTTLQIGSLMIYDNVTGSPQTVGLSGTGKTPK